MAEHARFADTTARLRQHYAQCGRCGDGARLCAQGIALWDETSMAFVEMVRSCARWHTTNHRGQARVEILLRKMERAFRRIKD